MNYDLEQLDECEWTWGADQNLLRNHPDLDVDHDYGVDIHGVPYVQGGGQATFALAWNINEPDTPVLVETRDYLDAEEAIGVYPILANARLVPTDNKFYQPVMAILMALHNG